MKSLRILLFTTTVLGTLVLSTPPARSTPVTNGRIAFQRLFFDADSYTERIALFTVRPDGTGVRQVTEPPRGVETGRVDWSPDGRRLAYMWVRDDPRNQIRLVRPNGTHREDLTKGHCAPPSCLGEEDPAWSPEGDRIAFIRTTGDGTRSIFVMSSDGTHRRRVMTPPSDRYADSAPAWSPDGRRLVFARVDGERKGGANVALFIVRLDGEKLRRITRWRLHGLNRPDWSPNGRWILFAKPDRTGATQLWRIHPNGTGFRQITHTPELYWDWGAFSPDGKWVTAYREPGELSQGDIYVMRLNGTHIRNVTGSLSLERESTEGLPDWGPR